MTRLDTNRSDRTVGVILLITAVLTAVTMAHHPSGHGGMLVYVVHGTMIVLLCSMFFGLCYYSMRRDLGRPLILAAMVAYLLNYFAHIIAGTVNGFIVPALAERGQDIPHALFVFAWESNQAFARLGTAATGVAFVLWGLDLLRQENGFSRLIGGFGLLAGVLPLVLLFNDSTMDVRTALIIYSLHAGFVALVALRLIQRKLPQAIKGL
jgi:hypothetical protein